MRLHTRINLTPTGIDPRYSLTIGNLWAARINCQLGQASGGTFIIQLEDLLARQQSIQYHNDREPYCQSQLQQLSHYGVIASSEEVLGMFGIRGQYRVMKESDYVPAIDLAWEVLPYREKCGDWPPPWPPNTHGSGDALVFTGKAYDGAGVTHPYVQTSRVVLDTLSRRNLFFNGDECREGRSNYHMIATLLGANACAQYTVPLLRCTPDDQKISCSSDPERNPFYVQKAIDAGLTYHELWDYLERVGIKGAFTLRDPKSFVKSLRPWPVINTEHWRKYLKARTNKRKDMLDEL